MAGERAVWACAVSRRSKLPRRRQPSRPLEETRIHPSPSFLGSRNGPWYGRRLPARSRPPGRASSSERWRLPSAGTRTSRPVRRISAMSTVRRGRAGACDAAGIARRSGREVHPGCRRGNETDDARDADDEETHGPGDSWVNGSWRSLLNDPFGCNRAACRTTGGDDTRSGR